MRSIQSHSLYESVTRPWYSAGVHPQNSTPTDASSAGIDGKPERFTAWHATTIALLAFGYSGYYFCRSNLSVVLPDLIQDLGRHGIAASEVQVRMGLIASLGTMAYALGKFVSGSMADLFGGRKNFLGGMAGSVLFTVLFAVGGGFPLFTLAWIGNRLFQSAGWVGLVKLTSRWFSYSTYGSVMAVLSLSYLFGDAVCRWVMGVLMAHGVGWRGVFFVDAAALAALLLANLMLLKETPEERGLPSPEVNPLNLYAGETHSKERVGLGAILLPLVKSFPFWMVCLLSLGTTLLRETFNFWTPTYFVQYVGLTPSVAAERSALFPLFGGVSVLLAGVLSDRLGLNGRNIVLVGGMAASTVCLGLLAHTPGHASVWTPVVLVTLVGFLMLGPYSYLAGAMSLDFGGKHGSATAAGIIDGVGYLAGWLSGDTVARITVAYGWKNAFLGLAAAALMTALVALVLAIHQTRAQGKVLGAEA
ncbi:MAG: MFS transporter [Acidobacteriota bacterium]|nr:MFS transporter [Acidobacteriota bacterium]